MFRPRYLAFLVVWRVYVELIVKDDNYFLLCDSLSLCGAVLKS